MVHRHPSVGFLGGNIGTAAGLGCVCGGQEFTEHSILFLLCCSHVCRIAPGVSHSENPQNSAILIMHVLLTTVTVCYDHVK